MFLLADCEATVRPVAVVPNSGATQNAYLEIKSRSKWKDDFVAWLEAPAVYDEVEDSDEDNEANGQDNYGTSDASSDDESADESEEEE